MTSALSTQGGARENVTDFCVHITSGHHSSAFQ